MERLVFFVHVFAICWLYIGVLVTIFSFVKDTYFMTKKEDLEKHGVLLIVVAFSIMLTPILIFYKNWN